MMEILLLAALVLVAPYAIFAWGRKESMVVYRGEATIAKCGLLPTSRSSSLDYDFYTVFLPDGTSTMVEASQARIKSLGDSVVSKIVITIKQQPLGGRTYISAIRWPGEEVSEEGDKQFGGVYLCAAYLILGILSLVGVLRAPFAEMLGTFGLAYPLLLLALSGWCAGWYLVKPVPADAQGKLLYVIPMGRGRAFLWGALCISFVLTGASLWYGGVLLLIGLNTSFALGQLLAMLFKSANCADSVERAQ